MCPKSRGQKTKRLTVFWFWEMFTFLFSFQNFCTFYHQK